MLPLAIRLFTKLQSHQHHDCSYSSMNENNHVLHCSLRGDTIQSHTFSLEVCHFGKRYRVCKDCGFCKIEYWV